MVSEGSYRAVRVEMSMIRYAIYALVFDYMVREGSYMAVRVEI